MSDQPQISPSSHFRETFESALLDYEKQTGITLATHPLAGQLRNCHSHDGITTLLQEQAQALGGFQGSDRITKIISDLRMLSTTVLLGVAIGLPFLPAEAIHTGLLVLLAAAKGMSASYYALADLLESIKRVFEHLEIYTKILPTPTTDDIVVNIMVDLLSIFARATKDFKQGRPLKFVKKLLGEREVEAVLQRLDRLTHDEAQVAALPTLRVIFSLVWNMRVVMNGGRASTYNVWNTLETLHQTTSDINKSKRQSPPNVTIIDRKDRDVPAGDMLQQDIRSWLSPPDPWKNHNIARESRHSGTGAWLVHDRTFLEWKWSRPGFLLWIHGQPGAGKSVLCSTIIQELDTMRKCGLSSLACFYYDFREDESQSLRGLLSSVLLQLCGQSDSYYDVISAFYLAHRDDAQSPTDDELIQCLKDVVELPGQASVYLILDALDECSHVSEPFSPREKVLTLLADLVDSQFPDLNLRICVTSRPEADIKTVLESLTFRSISLHDENRQKEDIEKYIKSFVNTNKSMGGWKQEYKQLVIDVVTKRAGGSFRWVYCQLVYLSRCDPEGTPYALDELPAKLDETHERMLLEINDTNWKSAHRLLSCVAVASRPLRVEELAEFLAFDFTDELLPRFREDWRPNDPSEAVLSTCSTLLTLVNVDGCQVVQFRGSLAKEYMMSSRFATKGATIPDRDHIYITRAHTLVTKACLGMLLHLHKTITSDDLQTFPLADYAARHWVDHATFARVSPHLINMDELFDRSRPHFSIWIWIYNPVEPSSRVRQRKKPSTPRGSHLHYAAYCGLCDALSPWLIERPEVVNSRCFDNNTTPLHLASQRGHVKSARFLLDHGADPMAQDWHGWSPLHIALSDGRVELVNTLLWHNSSVKAQDQAVSIKQLQASSMGIFELVNSLHKYGENATAKDRNALTPLHLASGGHLKLANTLLEYGADVTAHDRQGWTPLHLASSGGHVNLVKILLRYGADATAKDQNNWTSLHRASSRGHADIIRILIEHGADVDARDNDNCSSLHRASEHGHLGTACLLLDYGAEVDVKDHSNWTPLHGASQNGHLEVVQVLLGWGADADALDYGGWSPLHLASRSGHLEIVRVLIERGVDVNTRDNGNWTPLHGALQQEHQEVARILLKHGADANSQDSSNRTPLLWALRQGHQGVVPVLLEHGADANSRDNSNLTPLLWASREGYEGIVRVLLEHGADANSRDDSYLTPLHRALRQGHESLVRVLLEYGADANSQDNSNLTPLHWASRQGHESLVRVLLEYGADANSRDDNNWTPLLWATREGYESIVRVLLEHGADANSQDDSNLTPLHRALRQGHESLVRVLLEYGADANSQDNSNMTPLHWASRQGHESLVHVLLEYGADANSQDNSNLTPLHWASRQGHESLVRVLLEHGADANSLDDSNWTPLHTALQQEHYEVIWILLDHDAYPHPQDENTKLILLHAASRLGQPKVVGALLNRGANVNSQDQNNLTLLHCASQYGHHEVVQIRLEHGAHTNSLSGDDWTPLHSASQEGHQDVVRVLLKHGADANSRDYSNLTPLHKALRQGHWGVVRDLLEHGADANSRDDSNLTPLHWSLRQGHGGVIRDLLKHGADANSQDDSNLTPLHWALRVLQQEREAVIRVLLEYGADANSRDDSNLTPLLWASRVLRPGHEGVIRVLLEHGADANSRDDSNLTPLHWTSRQGLEGVSMVLLQHGADPNHRDNSSETPLHLASRADFFRVVKLLIKFGADIHARNREGRMALGVAPMKRGKRCAAWILRKAGKGT